MTSNIFLPSSPSSNVVGSSGNRYKRPHSAINAATTTSTTTASSTSTTPIHATTATITTTPINTATTTAATTETATTATTMDIKPFIYGCIGGTIAEVGTFPIDTAKTRLQIQGQVIEKTVKEKKYKGMLHTMYRISREEGVLALYNGIKPALLRQATYGTMSIGLYHGLKEHIRECIEMETLMTNILAGVVSGSISSAIANPTEVLKIRLQAQTVVSASNQGIVTGLERIYRLEGLKGLYRGLMPSAQRAGIISGVHLPAYDFSKRCILDSNIFEDGDCVYTHLLASFCSGLITSFVSNPIDVIKTRMMSQQNIPGRTGSYKNSLDCLSCTCRTEGLQALFKGLVPGFFRYGPWSVIFFVTYEQLRIMGENILPT